MTNDDDSRPSRAELAVDLLDAYSLWVGLGGVAIAIVFGAVLWTRGVPGVPRYWRVFGVSAAACAALGYPAVVKVLRWLYDPSKRYLVQPGVSEDDGGIWRLSPSDYEDLTVLDGDLYQWPGTKYPVYEVEWYDRERNTCKATWRGSASDGEMIRNQQRIDQVRSYLEERAKERDILMTRVETIVREAILDNARLIVEEYNRASLVDVTSITDRVDNIIDEATLTDDLRDISQQRTDPETDAQPETVSQPTQRPQAAADGGTEVNDV